MRVTIVTSSTCPECEKMKRKLLSAGIQFSEAKIDQDSDMATEMVFNGIISVPAFVVEEGGKKKWMSRANFESWLSATSEKISEQRKWISVDYSKQ